jgi:HPt (histidine-containing phosphotransfer) domain-containing protein
MTPRREDLAKEESLDPLPVAVKPMTPRQVDVEPQYEVISWPDALEQCGGDEEFLRELVGDLKTEVVDNFLTIRTALNERPTTWADSVRRAGHAIKGATANLMCHEMSHFAKAIELRAKASPAGTEDDFAVISKLADELDAAIGRYSTFIDGLK